MTQPLTGSCQCGAVSFEVSGSFQRFYLCHCSRCRKDTGSAHAANLFSASAELRWRSGGDLVTCYRVPSTRHQKCFCRICGSALPRLETDGTVIVPAGSLDDRFDKRPDAHICYASRAAWDDHLETVPRLDGLPD